MEINQARKLLLEKGDELSDLDLQRIINTLNKIIEVGFQQFENLNLTEEIDNVVIPSR